MIVVILVGFERVFTSVDEDIGSFELCIRIFTEASLLPTNIDFSLDLVSIPDTAGMYGSDSVLFMLTHMLSFSHLRYC